MWGLTKKGRIIQALHWRNTAAFLYLEDISKSYSNDLDFKSHARAEISLRPPGWNIPPPTGLKYYCNYMLNFGPGIKRKFPQASLLRCENTVDAHARVPFSAQDEKNDSDYMDFSARLTGVKILAWFEGTGLSPGWIAAQAESLFM